VRAVRRPGRNLCRRTTLTGAAVRAAEPPGPSAPPGWRAGMLRGHARGPWHPAFAGRARAAGVAVAVPGVRQPGHPGPAATRRAGGAPPPDHRRDRDLRAMCDRAAARGGGRGRPDRGPGRAVPPRRRGAGHHHHAGAVHGRARPGRADGGERGRAARAGGLAQERGAARSSHHLPGRAPQVRPGWRRPDRARRRRGGPGRSGGPARAVPAGLDRGRADPVPRARSPPSGRRAEGVGARGDGPAGAAWRAHQRGAAASPRLAARRA
jgi:hypothetical protein